MSEVKIHIYVCPMLISGQLTFFLWNWLYSMLFFVLSLDQSFKFKLKTWLLEWEPDRSFKFKDMTSVGTSELAKVKKLNCDNFYLWKHKIMLAPTLEILIYVLEKLYPILPKRPTKEQTKELKNYTIDDLMAKTIILAYI